MKPWKPCEQCKKPHQPERSDARFCSDACRKASKRGVPAVPFDQEDAQLILDVIASTLKFQRAETDPSRMQSYINVVNAEKKHYYDILAEAVASMAKKSGSKTKPDDDQLSPLPSA